MIKNIRLRPLFLFLIYGRENSSKKKNIIIKGKESIQQVSFKAITRTRMTVQEQIFTTELTNERIIHKKHLQVNQQSQTTPFKNGRKDTRIHNLKGQQTMANKCVSNYLLLTRRNQTRNAKEDGKVTFFYLSLSLNES